MWRDDERKTTVKENDDGEWSSEGVVLWLVRRQNGDAVEWWWEWLKLRWLFLWVQGGSRTVRRGWSTTVVWIQCFSFCSREEMWGQIVVGRWSRGNELVLAQLEGNVTRCGGVTTSTRGDATLGRKKGGNDVSWADANLTRSKNEKKSTQLIELVQMDGGDLKQQWVNFF
jgi:hypothetical protein